MNILNVFEIEPLKIKVRRKLEKKCGITIKMVSSCLMNNAEKFISTLLMSL